MSSEARNHPIPQWQEGTLSSSGWGDKPETLMHGGVRLTRNGDFVEIEVRTGPGERDVKSFRLIASDVAEFVANSAHLDSAFVFAEEWQEAP